MFDAIILSILYRPKKMACAEAARNVNHHRVLSFRAIWPANTANARDATSPASAPACMAGTHSVTIPIMQQASAIAWKTAWT